jgi:hypothetical protein
MTLHEVEFYLDEHPIFYEGIIKAVVDVTWYSPERDVGIMNPYHEGFEDIRILSINGKEYGKRVLKSIKQYILNRLEILEPRINDNLSIHN